MKVVPTHHANTFKHLSWLSLFSSWYGYMRGHHHAYIPACVWFTSLIYWSHNDYSVWRYIDIVVVQMCLWFQFYYAQFFSTGMYFKIYACLGMCCFFNALVSKYAWKDEKTSFVSHCLVHILGNVGNVILYTGTFHPNYRKLNYFSCEKVLQHPL